MNVTVLCSKLVSLLRNAFVMELSSTSRSHAETTVCKSSAFFETVSKKSLYSELSSAWIFAMMSCSGKSLSVGLVSVALTNWTSGVGGRMRSKYTGSGGRT